MYFYNIDKMSKFFALSLYLVSNLSLLAILFHNIKLVKDVMTHVISLEISSLAIFQKS